MKTYFLQGYNDLKFKAEAGNFKNVSIFFYWIQKNLQKFPYLIFININRIKIANHVYKLGDRVEKYIFKKNSIKLHYLILFVKLKFLFFKFFFYNIVIEK